MSRLKVLSEGPGSLISFDAQVMLRIASPKVRQLLIEPQGYLVFELSCSSEALAFQGASLTGFLA